MFPSQTEKNFFPFDWGTFFFESSTGVLAEWYFSTRTNIRFPSLRKGSNTPVDALLIGINASGMEGT